MTENFLMLSLGRDDLSKLCKYGFEIEPQFLDKVQSQESRLSFQTYR